MRAVTARPVRLIFGATWPRPNRPQRGSVLALVLIFGLMLFALAASVVDTAVHQYRTAERSLKWSQALAVAEAGAEEAFHEIAWGGRIWAGWTPKDGGFEKTSPLVDHAGKHIGVYRVTVQNPDDLHPVVYSRGYIPSITHAEVKRSVRVDATRDTKRPFFEWGIYGYSDMDFGQDFYMDSWNSETDGQYDALKKHTYGNIGGATGVSALFSGSMANVYGSIQIGGTTGNVAAQGANPEGQPNEVIENSPATLPPPFPDEELALARVVNDNFNINGMNGNSSTAYDSATQTLNESVTLLPGTYHFKGINISPSGGGIECSGEVVIYLEGDWIAGEVPHFNTLGKKPSHLRVFQKSGNISWGNNPRFYGALYAPNTTLTGLGNNPQLYGALVVSSLVFDQSLQVHYDESLGKPVLGDSATVSSWVEIPPTY